MKITFFFRKCYVFLDVVLEVLDVVLQVVLEVVLFLVVLFLEVPWPGGPGGDPGALVGWFLMAKTAEKRKNRKFVKIEIRILLITRPGDLRFGRSFFCLKRLDSPQLPITP